MSCPLRESLTLASAVNGTRARLFGRRGQGPNSYAILMNSNKLGRNSCRWLPQPDDRVVFAFKLRLCSVAMHLLGTKSLLTHSSLDNDPQTNRVTTQFQRQRENANLCRSPRN